MIDWSKYSDIELSKLLAEKKSASEQAFLELYRRYSTKIYNYCLFKVNIKENAEEIFQESWIRFNNSAQKQNGVENVQAYLIVIAKNLIAEYYRNTKKDLLADTYQDFDWERIICPNDFAVNLENKELLNIIKIAVNNLEDIYREAFILNKFNDMNYSEIAEMLGETTECVKKRVYRAMDMVKFVLRPYIKELSNC